MKLKTLIPKSEVRRIVVRRRKEIDDSEIRLKTKSIVNQLSALDDFIFAKKIHSFISSRLGEIDTKYLIDFVISSGKSVVLPRLNKTSKKFQHASFLNWDSLIKNSDGYFEPSVAFDDDISDIDLIIVPAIAVSVFGQRVGYGGGFYDAFLKNNHIKKIVPVFEFQVFENIETEEHDIRVDKIITERRVIDTRSK